jgi:hypothetical protein
LEFDGGRLGRAETVSRCRYRARKRRRRGHGGVAGERALDWFNFFLADIQTGFGPSSRSITAHA